MHKKFFFIAVAIGLFLMGCSLTLPAVVRPEATQLAQGSIPRGDGLGTITAVPVSSLPLVLTPAATVTPRPPQPVAPTGFAYQGMVLPTPKPVDGLPTQPPPAWLTVGSDVVAGTFAAGGSVSGHIDPVMAIPDLPTATLPGDGQLVIVVGARVVSQFQATIRPWSKDGSIIPLFDTSARELSVTARRDEKVTAFTLTPSGNVSDQLLRVYITFPDSDAFYLWRLNPDLSPYPGATPTSAPIPEQASAVMPKAVYFIRHRGQIDPEDLYAHPEVVLVHTVEEFEALGNQRIALWVDKDVLTEVDQNWLHQVPQKYNPLVVVGYNDALYAFREKLDGFGIEGPYVDWSTKTLEPGFSVWALQSDSGSVPLSSVSAFMQGYRQPPTVANILAVTESFVERTPVH